MNLNDHTHSYLETALADFSLPPIPTVETASLMAAYSKENHVSEASQKSMSGISVHPNWLEHAAPVYNISSDIKDYMTVPVILMASDLPNRNLTAFPATELSAFSPSIGDLTYRGWRGKPVYIDHNNLVYNRAIGAVVDVSMRKLSVANGADLYKVVALLAIDTSKGQVPRDIMAGRREHYSMGALVRAYSCSVCAGKGYMGAQTKTKFDALPCKKKHVGVDRSGNMRLYEQEDGSSTLGYMNAHEVTPFEVSSVPTPAFSSATVNKDLISYFQI